jgi:hypothetical protein
MEAGSHDDSVYCNHERHGRAWHNSHAKLILSMLLYHSYSEDKVIILPSVDNIIIDPHRNRLAMPRISP